VEIFRKLKEYIGARQADTYLPTSLLGLYCPNILTRPNWEKQITCPFVSLYVFA